MTFRHNQIPICPKERHTECFEFCRHRPLHLYLGGVDFPIERSQFCFVAFVALLCRCRFRGGATIERQQDRMYFRRGACTDGLRLFEGLSFGKPSHFVSSLIGHHLFGVLTRPDPESGTNDNDGPS